MYYSFGDCTLDTQRYELRRSGERVPLRRKVFQVLVYLLEQRDRVVSRDELLAQVWPNQRVGEETLTSCVKAVRRAVGDSGRAQQVIQTVHGRGLRFMAEVTVTDAPLAAPVIAPPPPAPRPPAAAAAASWWGARRSWRPCSSWYTTARQGTAAGGVHHRRGRALVKPPWWRPLWPSVAAEADVWIGYGQCIDQYGMGEAYLPVLEALGRLCRGPEGAHFLTWLQQHAPSWLGQMPALLPDADRDAFQRLARDATQARMLRELAEALEYLTVERPLILILEDLHWSDGATLDWLAYVARRRDPARLLVLATYRPAEARVAAQPARIRSPSELLVHGQGAELVLVALSVAEVAAYVTQRFGAGPLAAAAHPGAVPAHAGASVIPGHHGGGSRAPWYLTGWPGPAGNSPRALDPATVGVPETLRQLIEQQFERLAPARAGHCGSRQCGRGGFFRRRPWPRGWVCSVEEVDTPLCDAGPAGAVPAGPGGRRPGRTARWQATIASGMPCIRTWCMRACRSGARTRMHQQIGRAAGNSPIGNRPGRLPPSWRYTSTAGGTGCGPCSIGGRRRRMPCGGTVIARLIAHCTAGLDAAGHAAGDAGTHPPRTGPAHAILGPALIAAQGYAAPEVEQHLHPGARALSTPWAIPRSSSPSSSG